MDSLRVTLAVATVLRVFLEDPQEPQYGYDLMRATGFPSGKVYPILARLQRAGWLVREFEDIDPEVERRPRRRIYRLTAEATMAARLELAHISTVIAQGTSASEKLKIAGGFA